MGILALVTAQRAAPKGAAFCLGLGFALDALDLTHGDANATGAEFGNFHFAISAESPEEHTGDFPALAEFGWREVSGGGGVWGSLGFHGVCRVTPR